MPNSTAPQLVVDMGDESTIPDIGQPVNQVDTVVFDPPLDVPANEMEYYRKLAEALDLALNL